MPSPRCTLTIVLHDDASQSEPEDSRTLITRSALTEIENSGIVGMRLSAVAEGAHVSIPLISRHFGNRDGLLAAALGDWFKSFVFRYRQLVEDWLDSAEAITIEEFAQLAPKPDDDVWRKDRDFRLKVLAASLENEELRRRITEVTREGHRWMAEMVERGRPKLPPSDRHFDARIFTVLLFNTMFIFNDMLDDSRISSDEYQSFIIDLFRASSHHRASEQ